MELIDSKVASDVIGMSRCHLEQLVDAGSLVGTREMTGRVLIERASLVSFLSDRELATRHCREAAELRERFGDWRAPAW